MKSRKLPGLFVPMMILSSFSLFSQEDYEDVVYLKNDSDLHGRIIEQVPDVSIKIQIYDRRIFVYQRDEVEKKSDMFINETNQKSINMNGYKEGYECVIEMGSAIELWPDSRFQKDDQKVINLIKLNVINGYRFNPYSFLGIGTGITRDWGESDYIIGSEYDHFLIPLFLDFRLDYNDAAISPYVSWAFGAGYSYNITDDLGIIGYLLNPSAGCNFKVSNKLTVNCGISYEMQNMQIKGRTSHGAPYKEVINRGFLGLNVGISF